MDGVAAFVRRIDVGSAAASRAGELEHNVMGLSFLLASRSRLLWGRGFSTRHSGGPPGRLLHVLTTIGLQGSCKTLISRIEFEKACEALIRASHSLRQPRTAWHGLARPHTASHGLTRPHTAWHGLARPRTAWHGLARPARPRTASHGLAQPRHLTIRLPAANLQICMLH